MIIFEKITDKPIQLANSMDWITLVYACLLSANWKSGTELGITMEELIDDAEEAEIRHCAEWLTEKVRSTMLAGGEQEKSATDKTDKT